jgi:hypothetical protein
MTDVATVFQVWHDDSPRFRATHEDAMRWPTGFTHVADVLTTQVEAVFELTNHIDSDWTKNAEVTLLVPNRVRSTSVGDVVVDDTGQAWLCAGMGWEKI